METDYSKYVTGICNGTGISLSVQLMAPDLTNEKIKGLHMEINANVVEVSWPPVHQSRSTYPIAVHYWSAQSEHVVVSCKGRVAD